MLAERKALDLLKYLMHTKPDVAATFFKDPLPLRVCVCVCARAGV